MTKSIKLSDLIFLLPILIVLSVVAIVNLPFYQTAPKSLTYAVTFDLLLTTPLVYFLIIRKKDIPKITVASVFVACLVVAHYIIPPAKQTFLNQLTYWLFPIVEFFVISYVVISAQRTIRQFKVEKKASPDFYTALCIACKAALPKRAAMLFATEIAVVYYALFAWAAKPIPKANEFTSYKKNGIISVVYALMMIVLAETFAVHMLVERWSELAAWILTWVSLYTCIQLFALVRSLPKRLTYIDKAERKLYLRSGFINETIIDIDTIVDIKLTARALPEDGSVVKFSALGDFDSHNIILHLKEETILYKIYGMQKRFKSLALYMDEKELFVNQLKGGGLEVQRYKGIKVER